MDKIQKMNEPDFFENEIGLLLWKLESVENFFPCYKTLINKEK